MLDTTLWPSDMTSKTLQMPATAINFGPKWDTAQEIGLRQLLGQLLENTKIIIIAGAGISASAGSESILFALTRVS